MTLEDMYPPRLAYDYLEKKAIELTEELAQALKRADIAESRVKELEHMLAGTASVDGYQRAALRTVPVGTSKRDRLLIGALNLAAEAGEVVDIIKKHVFHGHALDEAALVSELGDVKWPIAVIADAIGVALSRVTAKNDAKLRARYPEGFSEEASRNRPPESAGVSP